MDVDKQTNGLRMEECGMSLSSEPVPLDFEIEHHVTPAKGRYVGVACSPYFPRKRIVARILATILLVPGLPVMAVLLILVRLTSRGPSIYRQLRVGLHGKTFWMYKIRTMRRDAEVSTGPVWSQDGDRRVIPIGRWLRRHHLDELPQLINVIRGEMDLVGPRPERPEFVHWLARELPGYLDRLAVPPGITGSAQINLPPDSDLDSVRRKLVLDLDYIQHATFLWDLRMIACSLLRIVGIPGDWAVRVAHVSKDIDEAFEPCTRPSETVELTSGGIPAVRSSTAQFKCQANRDPSDNGRTEVRTGRADRFFSK
jgi:lipopolysaccharide/colanic/teichoic acid biosynthesis glycosyltransferase